MTANEITAQILLRIPAEIPGARAWRRNVGAMRTGHGFVRFGLPGEADITGILPGGQRLEIEVKAGRDVLTEPQRKFLAMIRGAGGFAIVARDPETALHEIRIHVLSHRTSPTTSEPEESIPGPAAGRNSGRSD